MAAARSVVPVCRESAASVSTTSVESSGPPGDSTHLFRILCASAEAPAQFGARRGYFAPSGRPIWIPEATPRIQITSTSPRRASGVRLKQETEYDDPDRVGITLRRHCGGRGVESA